MELSTGIQEGLLALLCYDNTPGGGKFVAGLLSHADYDPYYRDIAKAAIKYISKYDKVPGEHTVDLVEQLQRRYPEQSSLFTQIYEVLMGLQETSNREFILANAAAFCRYQSLKQGISAAINHLDADTEEGVEQASLALNNSLERSYDLFDTGTLLTDTSKVLRFLDATNQPFQCGIKEMDNVRLGPARKRLHLMVAPSGRGKSWWLVHLAKLALLQRKKVLYVTLELSEEEVCGRFMQSLFSVRKRDQEIVTQLFKCDEMGRFSSMSSFIVQNRRHLEEEGIRAHLIDRIETVLQGRRPPLVVKEFPTGFLNVRGLESYIEMLEASISFIPDMLCIDYPDIMEISTAGDYRHSIGAVYKQLRGLGVKRNMAVCAVTQTNKAGATAKLVTEVDSAESYEKIAISDTVFTYSQTKAEKALNLARIYADKGRTDISKFEVLISQAYGIGQFCLHSTLKSKTYERAVDGPSEVEPDFDDDDDL